MEFLKNFTFFLSEPFFEFYDGIFVVKSSTFLFTLLSHLPLSEPEYDLLSMYIVGSPPNYSFGLTVDQAKDGRESAVVFRKQHL